LKSSPHKRAAGAAAAMAAEAEETAADFQVEARVEELAAVTPEAAVDILGVQAEAAGGIQVVVPQVALQRSPRSSKCSY